MEYHLQVITQLLRCYGITQTDAVESCVASMTVSSVVTPTAALSRVLRALKARVTTDDLKGQVESLFMKLVEGDNGSLPNLLVAIGDEIGERSIRDVLLPQREHVSTASDRATAAAAAAHMEPPVTPQRKENPAAHSRSSLAVSASGPVAVVQAAAAPERLAPKQVSAAVRFAASHVVLDGSAPGAGPRGSAASSVASSPARLSPRTSANAAAAAAASAPSSAASGGDLYPASGVNALGSSRRVLAPLSRRGLPAAAPLVPQFSDTSIAASAASSSLSAAKVDEPRPPSASSASATTSHAVPSAAGEVPDDGTVLIGSSSNRQGAGTAPVPTEKQQQHRRAVESQQQQRQQQQHVLPTTALEVLLGYAEDDDESAANPSALSANVPNLPAHPIPDGCYVMLRSQSGWSGTATPSSSLPLGVNSTFNGGGGGSGGVPVSAPSAVYPRLSPLGSDSTPTPPPCAGAGTLRHMHTPRHMQLPPGAGTRSASAASAGVNSAHLLSVSGTGVGCADEVWRVRLLQRGGSSSSSSSGDARSSGVFLRSGDIVTLDNVGSGAFLGGDDTTRGNGGSLSWRLPATCSSDGTLGVACDLPTYAEPPSRVVWTAVLPAELHAIEFDGSSASNCSSRSMSRYFSRSCRPYLSANDGVVLISHSECEDARAAALRCLVLQTRWTTIVQPRLHLDTAGYALVVDVPPQQQLQAEGASSSFSSSFARQNGGGAASLSLSAQHARALSTDGPHSPCVWALVPVRELQPSSRMSSSSSSSSSGETISSSSSLSAASSAAGGAVGDELTPWRRFAPVVQPVPRWCVPPSAAARAEACVCADDDVSAGAVGPAASVWLSDAVIAAVSAVHDRTLAAAAAAASSATDASSRGHDREYRAFGGGSSSGGGGGGAIATPSTVVIADVDTISQAVVVWHVLDALSGIPGDIITSVAVSSTSSSSSSSSSFGVDRVELMLMQDLQQQQQRCGRPTDSNGSAPTVHPSHHLHDSQHQPTRIPPPLLLLDAPLASMVRRFLPAANAFASCKALVDALLRPGSGADDVSAATAAAARVLLHEYSALLVQLEASIRASSEGAQAVTLPFVLNGRPGADSGSSSSGGGGGGGAHIGSSSGVHVSLQHVWYYLQPAFRTVSALDALLTAAFSAASAAATISGSALSVAPSSTTFNNSSSSGGSSALPPPLPSSSFSGGGVVINALLDAHEAGGGESTRTLTRFVLERACAPYLARLRKWLSHGLLDEDASGSGFMVVTVPPLPLPPSAAASLSGVDARGPPRWAASSWAQPSSLSISSFSNGGGAAVDDDADGSTSTLSWGAEDALVPRFVLTPHWAAVPRFLRRHASAILSAGKHMHVLRLCATREAEAMSAADAAAAAAASLTPSAAAAASTSRSSSNSVGRFVFPPPAPIPFGCDAEAYSGAVAASRSFATRALTEFLVNPNGAKQRGWPRVAVDMGLASAPVAAAAASASAAVEPRPHICAGVVGSPPLLAILSALKSSFFTARGDFVHHFLEAAEGELAREVGGGRPSSASGGGSGGKHVPPLSLHRLSVLLEASLRGGPISGDDAVLRAAGAGGRGLTACLAPSSVLAQVDAMRASNTAAAAAMQAQQRAPSSVGLKGYNVFCLDYTPAWPHTLVLTPSAMGKYCLIFRHLFFILHVERAVTASWAAQQSCKELELGPTLAASHALRHRMLHFLTNFAYYCSVEVIEPQWHALIERIGGGASASTTETVAAPTCGSSVASLVRAHDHFLDACLAGCLLSSPDTLKLLTKLVTLCLLFSNQISSAIAAHRLSDDELDARAGLSRARRRARRRLDKGAYYDYSGGGGVLVNAGTQADDDDEDAEEEEKYGASSSSSRRAAGGGKGAPAGPGPAAALDRQRRLARIGIQTDAMRHTMAQAGWQAMIRKSGSMFDALLREFVVDLRSRAGGGGQLHAQHVESLLARLNFNGFLSSHLGLGGDGGDGV